MAQVQREAYAIEAAARAAAGRKTSNATDGTGGTPISQTFTDAQTSDFNQGTFTNTMVQAGALTTLQVSSDNFDSGTLASFWTGVDPTAWGSMQTSGGYTGGYYGHTPATQLQTGSNNWDYIYLNLALPASFNVTTKLAYNTTTWGEGNMMTVTYGAPTTQTRINQTFKVALGVIGSGSAEDGLAVYKDTANATHWWTGSAWTTTSGTLFSAGPMSAWYQVWLARDANWFNMTLKRLDTGAVVTVIKLAVSSVMNGAAGFNYLAAGQVQNTNWWASTNLFGFKLDDFSVTPTIVQSSGTFISRTFSSGEWTARFTQATWTQTGTAMGLQVRYSNNSDMSSAAAWKWVAKATDTTAKNYRGGFWQYQAYLNASDASVTSLTLTYTSKSHGTSPSAGIPTALTQDTAWVAVSLSLSKVIYANLTASPSMPSNTVLRRTAWVNNSLLDFGNYRNVQYAFYFGSLGTTSYAIPVDFELYVANSTVKNFGNLSATAGLYPQVETLHWHFDNATLDTFNTVPNAGTVGCSGNWNTCLVDVHDSNLREYNKADVSYAALTYVQAVNRTYANNPTARATGSIASGARWASWDRFEGGYNQFVFQSAATGSGQASEYVNWSNNYIANSTHTALGFHGLNPGTMFGGSLSGGYYGTIYRNYVNNSKYIIIQTSGNASNLRVIQNYEQGPSTSFTEAMGFNWRTHDLLVATNYIWNSNTTNNDGIVVSDFAYNVTITGNVIYNVGTYPLWLTNAGLKFQRSGGIEWSDYAWKGMNWAISNNYISGSWNNEAVHVDNGYAVFTNNTVVGVGPGKADVLLADNWNTPGASYTYVDWRGGYVNTSNIGFSSSIAAVQQGGVWFRYWSPSRIEVRDAGGAFNVLQVLAPGGAGTWGISVPCTQGPYDGPAVAQLWTGTPCTALADGTSFTFSGDQTRYLWLPYTWVNKTRTLPYATQLYTSQPNARVFDRTKGQYVTVYAGSSLWTVPAGDDLLVTFGAQTTSAPPGGPSGGLLSMGVQASVFIPFIVIIFVAALAFAVHEVRKDRKTGGY